MRLQYCTMHWGSAGNTIDDYASGTFLRSSHPPSPVLCLSGQPLSIFLGPTYMVPTYGAFPNPRLPSFPRRMRYFLIHHTVFRVSKCVSWNRK